MYLAELKLTNFRRFGANTDNRGTQTPGLSLQFNPGLNLLVGENDSGKTAIADAVKLVLLTESHEYLRLEYEDFHLPPGDFDESARAKSLKIECIFKGFDHEQAKNFLEWLSFYKDGQEERYSLRVLLDARRDNSKIVWDVKAGPDPEGGILDSLARDFLRAVYLKPLRDAESELAPGRRSRLAQVLDAHEAFKSAPSDHHLVKVAKKANKGIQNYFKGLDADDEPLPDQAGKKLLIEVNEYLSEFFTKREKNKTANFTMSPSDLKSILERLALDLAETKAGLGSYNRLYVATELLLLKRNTYSGLKLGLIEEIESHLHPQAQLRLIEYLQTVITGHSGVQLILTSHSPNLASKVKLENLIICRYDGAFPMDSSSTELEKGDYLYLERFLDVTKANLFFAQGVILVEGDAENILIPEIAKIIGRPLSKHGVSVVNVNSTAFLRYSRIFRRKNQAIDLMGVPVAVVTDNDMKPNPKTTAAEIEANRLEKASRYDGQGVKSFVSFQWTLEFDISLGILNREFYTAVLRAEKVQNNNQICLNQEKCDAVNKQVKRDFEGWEGKSAQDIAFHIYSETMLGKNISKAIVAQCFVDVLGEQNTETLKTKILEDRPLKYLVDAIAYACGG